MIGTEANSAVAFEDSIHDGVLPELVSTTRNNGKLKYSGPDFRYHLFNPLPGARPVDRNPSHLYAQLCSAA